ncbi:MAG: type II CAAX prenyl endopeptidase Rce1 family protein [Candidatus Thorarchaeota archaeon]
MSEEDKKKIKFCVFCGKEFSDAESELTYCPKCGKLIVKLEGTEKSTEKSISQKSISVPRTEISRKCPGCGSIITSTILNQCPICDTVLEKVPDVEKVAVQKKPGFIFTDKRRLEPEQKFLLKTDKWNLKEGLNVFFTCIYVYIIVNFLIYFLLIFQGGDLPQSILTFLISRIPEILFFIYPLYYIRSKHHSFKKLGFPRGSKKITISIFIGLLGTFILILLDLLHSSLIDALAQVGWDFFNTEAQIALTNQIIRDAGFLWVFLLTTLMVVGSFSMEVVFRGVLHNTLKQKYRNHIYVILLVALGYSVLMVAFYPNPTFFLFNFLGFVILGIIYEVTDGNIYSTIIASIAYTILSMILVFF